MNRPCPSRRRDRGFTLIELLVVIVILGILMSLLLPVIFGAYRNARDAGVVAELTLLQNGLAQFKSKFGDYPPSRVMLSESGFYPAGNTSALSSMTWLGGAANVVVDLPIRDAGTGNLGNGTSNFSGNDLTVGQLAERSVRYLRKFWPRTQFSTSQAIYNANSGWHDFNGNGVLDTNFIYLEGHEALVFFLGGITNHTGTAVGMDGFAKNPANPFQNSAMVTTSRDPAMFTFQGGRLIDDDGDGVPGYIDSLNSGQDGRYYVYFSSYGNGGYDPNDVNFAEPDPQNPLVNSAVARAFRVNFAVFNPLVTPPPSTIIGSFGPNPYTISDPAVWNTPTAYHNPNSFQIVSAGRDGNYGIGGWFNSTANDNKLPLTDAPTAGISGQSFGSNYRVVEQENLANFATTRLDQ